MHGLVGEACECQKIQIDFKIISQGIYVSDIDKYFQISTFYIISCFSDTFPDFKFQTNILFICKDKHGDQFETVVTDDNIFEILENNLLMSTPEAFCIILKDQATTSATESAYPTKVNNPLIALFK